jgi:tetratricopeptide (TPR) repeat protein
MVYHYSGRFAEAEGMYRRVLDIEPGFLWTRYYLARVLLADKRPEEALAITQGDDNKLMREQALAIILQAVGSTSEADEALNTMIRQWADISAYPIALAYACRGDNDLALEWLERAYQQRDSALPEILGEPLFKSVANDPRFKDFLRKMNLPTEPVPVNWQ